MPTTKWTNRDKCVTTWLIALIEVVVLPAAGAGRVGVLVQDPVVEQLLQAVTRCQLYIVHLDYDNGYLLVEVVLAAAASGVSSSSGGSLGAIHE